MKIREAGKLEEWSPKPQNGSAGDMAPARSMVQHVLVSRSGPHRTFQFGWCYRVRSSSLTHACKLGKFTNDNMRSKLRNSHGEGDKTRHDSAFEVSHCACRRSSPEFLCIKNNLPSVAGLVIICRETIFGTSEDLCTKENWQTKKFWDNVVPRQVGNIVRHQFRRVVLCFLVPMRRISEHEAARGTTDGKNEFLEVLILYISENPNQSSQDQTTMQIVYPAYFSCKLLIQYKSTKFWRN